MRYIRELLYQLKNIFKLSFFSEIMYVIYFWKLHFLLMKIGKGILGKGFSKYVLKLGIYEESLLLLNIRMFMKIAKDVLNLGFYEVSLWPR